MSVRRQSNETHCVVSLVMYFVLVAFAAAVSLSKFNSEGATLSPWQSGTEREGEGGQNVNWEL